MHSQSVKITNLVLAIMYKQVDKPKKSAYPTNNQKSQAATNSVTQKKTFEKQFVGFTDNRPQATAQRQLQEMACNSRQYQQQSILSRGITQNLVVQLALSGPEAQVRQAEIIENHLQEISVNNGQILFYGERLEIIEQKLNQVDLEPSSALQSKNIEEQELGEEWFATKHFYRRLIGDSNFQRQAVLHKAKDTNLALIEPYYKPILEEILSNPNPEENAVEGVNLGIKTAVIPSPEIRELANETWKVERRDYDPELTDFSSVEKDRMSGSRSLQGGFFGPTEKTKKNIGLWKEADAMVRTYAKKNGLNATAQEINDMMYQVNIKSTEGTTLSGKIRTDSRGGGLLSANQIPKELYHFCVWLASELKNIAAERTDPFTVAGIAGVKLNSIHPFGDGNGRVVNMVIDFILMSSGLPPSSAGTPTSHVNTGDTGDIEENVKPIDNAVKLVHSGVIKSMETIKK